MTNDDVLFTGRYTQWYWSLGINEARMPSVPAS
jgi:hypothetical protein